MLFSTFFNTFDSTAKMIQLPGCFMLLVTRKKGDLIVNKLNNCMIADTVLKACIVGEEAKNIVLDSAQRSLVPSIQVKFEQAYSMCESEIVLNIKSYFDKAYGADFYKTLKCALQCEEDIDKCEFYHSAIDRRRSPLYTYCYKMCPYMKASYVCVNGGDSCPFSHNFFEVMFHPLNYKTKLCSKTLCQQQSHCYFAHENSPDLLYTNSWKDLAVYGFHKTLEFFDGALKGRVKLKDNTKAKVLLISPSVNLLTLLEKACGGNVLNLASETQSQEFNSDCYDAFLTTPSKVALEYAIFSTRVNVMIIHNVKHVLGTPDHKNHLLMLCRRLDLSAVNKVFVADADEAHAGREVTEALGIPVVDVKEAESQPPSTPSQERSQENSLSRPQSPMNLRSRSRSFKSSRSRSRRSRSRSRWFKSRRSRSRPLKSRSRSRSFENRRSRSRKSHSRSGSFRSRRSRSRSLKSRSRSRSLKKNLSQSRSFENRHSRSRSLKSRRSPAITKRYQHSRSRSISPKHRLSKSRMDTPESGRVRSRSKSCSRNPKARKRSRSQSPRIKRFSSRSGSQQIQARLAESRNSENVFSRSKRDHSPLPISEVSQKELKFDIPENTFRRMVGAHLYDEYQREEKRVREDHTEEYEVVCCFPDLHPEIEIYRNEFSSKFDRNFGSNKDELFKNQFWNTYWKHRLIQIGKDSLDKKINELKEKYIEKGKNTIGLPVEPSSVMSNSAKVTSQMDMSVSSSSMAAAVPLTSRPGTMPTPVSMPTHVLPELTRPTQAPHVSRRTAVAKSMAMLVTQRVTASSTSSKYTADPQASKYATTPALSGYLHESSASSPTTGSLTSQYAADHLAAGYAIDSSSSRATAVHPSSILMADASEQRSTETFPKYESPSSSGVLTSRSAKTASGSGSETSANTIISQPFSVENCINLLELLSGSLGILGSAVMAIVKAARKCTDPKEKLKVFKDEENAALINMASDKLKVIETSSSNNLAPLLSKARDWFQKLLEFAKNPPKLHGLNLKPIAIASLNRDACYAINLIKTALAYEGLSDLSKEDINTIYLEVCSLQFEMAHKNN